MEKDNRLLIIEESDNVDEKEESSAARLKLALANKKLKEDFFKENEFNQTTEIVNDDDEIYENEIDQSILEMEQTVGLTYESDSDIDAATTSNGNFSKRHTHSSSSTSSSEDDEGTISAKNSQLIESSVLQRKIYDEYQQTMSVMLPFYERRRLSECIEESESDDEVEVLVKPVIVVTPTNGSTQPATPKKRFIVTKTQEPDVAAPIIQPVSILKKTPSPPSNQKLLLTHSPKKIRYEAQGLKGVTAQQNSQTIHFPCSSGPNDRTNVKNFFSPQGFLNPHLDPRFFDTSLVEIRASQTLTNSSKSLNEKGDRKLDDNVWIKRKDAKPDDGKTSVSNDSIDRSKNNAGESVSFQRFGVESSNESY